MRYLYRDNRNFDCTDDECMVHEASLADMPENGNTLNIQDFYFRITCPFGDTARVYVMRTLRQANAIGTSGTPHYACTLEDTPEARLAAGVLAYAELTLDGAEHTITIWTMDPEIVSINGLSVTYSGTGDGFDALFCYTGTLAHYIADKTVLALRDYTGDGQALEGFAEANILSGPYGLSAASTNHLIYGSVVEEADAAAPASMFGVDLIASFIVAGCAFEGESHDVHGRLLEYAAAVRSIVYDELRTLNGITAGVKDLGITGLQFLEGPEEPYVGAAVEALIGLPYAQSDR